MNLAASRKMHPRKCPKDVDTQTRNANLREVHVHFLRAVSSCHHALVNNRQIQLRREHAINAALASAGINESANPCDTRNRNGTLRRLEIRIKSNVYE